MGAAIDIDPVALVRRARFFALAAIGFLAVATAQARVAPAPRSYSIDAKLAHFRDHKDEFDAVYFGSSLTFRHLDPRAVDATLEGTGLRLRGFNLGIPSMRAFEVDQYVDAVLALEPARLAWVFVEVPAWEPDFIRDEHIYTYRTVWWHSLPRTREAIRSTWLGDGHWVDKLELTCIHVKLALMKLTAYGQADRILDLPEAWPESATIAREALEAADGFEPLDGLRSPEFRNRRREFLRDLDRLARITARLDAQNARPVDLSGYNFAALESQIERIQRSGARVVYFAPPSIRPLATEHAVARSGALPAFLSFTSPQRYPRFYSADSHYDLNHLTAQGADEFSRVFAIELLRLWRSDGRR